MTIIKYLRCAAFDSSVFLLCLFIESKLLFNVFMFDIA